jgi:GNAT superfamily N-acetyltransferase
VWKRPEYVAPANLNCVGSYCTLARHSANGKVREFDTAVAFVTGVPIPLFNGCLALDATAGDAAQALDWMSRQGLPYLLWTGCRRDGRGTLASSLAADPDVALFTAYLDEAPVGTSIAIRTGDISGVYGVTTDPTARRRGVGTAAAWAAVNAGREWGCHLVTLQATEMGFSSYKKMGFTTVVRYRTSAPPAPSSQAVRMAPHPPNG